MLRKNKRLMSLTLSLLATASFNLYAQPVAQQTLVTPLCLLKNTTIHYQTLATNNAFSLITTDEAGIEQLSGRKHHQKAACGGFKNVTEAWHKYDTSNLLLKNKASAFLEKSISGKKNGALSESAAYTIQYPKQVNQLLQQLNPQNMWVDLTTLTHFDDRYANSDNGVKAAAWFKTQIETLAKNNNRKDIKVYYVQTGSNYKQPSVVVKMGDSDEPGVVIGGHMDTLSSTYELKPGADDDGTGSVTVLETARILINSGMHFKKPIYFIWYAAEELGLYGSSFVVDDFLAKKIPVEAVLQMDMTGYAYQNDKSMWIIDDYVNKKLSTYLQTLITTYVKQPIKHTQCGYACSDHASWTEGGYASSFAFETSFSTDNPYVHTSEDTMEKLSLDHMTHFAQLAVAFAVELAEPIS